MRLRHVISASALLITGTIIGVTTQQLATADVSPGDQPVLIPIEPCRLADTRSGANQVGPRSVPLGAGDTHTIEADEAGVPCDGRIPPEALTLSLNVTALQATELSFLTIWAGGPRPLAASLNPAPGQPPVPNAVVVDLSVDKTFDVYNDAGSVHVVVDVNGYYVDHDHDERYYTQTEVDDVVGELQEAIASTKFINLPTTRDFAGYDASEPYGASTERYGASIVIPPDYTPGTALRLRLTFVHGGAGACSFELFANIFTVLRDGFGNLDDNGGPLTEGLPDPGVVAFEASVPGRVVTREVLITAPGTLDMQPGDSLVFGFYRQGNDCVPGLIGVHSAAIYYE